jgi:AAA15 family ATPase/GTPase
VEVDLGYENWLIPIESVGEGVLRILKILIYMPFCKNGVILIDEIENGLHWSSMVTLWKAVFAAAEQYNVQIFATTHSQECIRAAVIANEDDDGNLTNHDISLHRIERLPDDTLKAIHYDAQRLYDAIDINWELR